MSFPGNKPPAATAYANILGYDYTKPATTLTDKDKVVALENFTIKSLNPFLEEMYKGLVRFAELYGYELELDVEANATKMPRLIRKATLIREKLWKLEELLTKSPGQRKPHNKKFPDKTYVDQNFVNNLKVLDEEVRYMQDSAGNINSKMSFGATTSFERDDDDFHDYRQFFQYLIHKYHRLAFSWQQIQIYAICQKIDIDKAPADVNQATYNLRTIYDMGMMTPEDFSNRRLQILDAMFMPSRAIGKTEKLRWDPEKWVNLNLLYGERKVKLPDMYDRDGPKDFDFYDEERKNDVEAARLRDMVFEHMAQGDKQPMLAINPNAVTMPRRATAADEWANQQEAAAKSGQKLNNPFTATMKPQFAVNAGAMAADMEERKRALEGGQGTIQRPKAKPNPNMSPEEYKQFMLDEYNRQQAENAELLRQKKLREGQ